MSQPIDFNGSNHVLGPPPGYTEEDVQRLHVHVYGKQSVSCWQLTPEELAEVQRTGCIYVNVLYGGGTQPPIYVGATLASTLF